MQSHNACDRALVQIPRLRLAVTCWNSHTESKRPLRRARKFVIAQDFLGSARYIFRLLKYNVRCIRHTNMCHCQQYGDCCCRKRRRSSRKPIAVLYYTVFGPGGVINEYAASEGVGLQYTAYFPATNSSGGQLPADSGSSFYTGSVLVNSATETTAQEALTYKQALLLT